MPRVSPRSGALSGTEHQDGAIGGRVDFAALPLDKEPDHAGGNALCRAEDLGAVAVTSGQGLAVGNQPVGAVSRQDVIGGTGPPCAAIQAGAIADASNWPAVVIRKTVCTCSFEGRRHTQGLWHYRSQEGTNNPSSNPRQGISCARHAPFADRRRAAPRRGLPPVRGPRPRAHARVPTRSPGNFDLQLPLLDAPVGGHAIGQISIEQVDVAARFDQTDAVGVWAKSASWRVHFP